MNEDQTPDYWLFAKTNDVRWIDVFVLGPFMVWFAAKAKGVPDWARTAMLASGVLTIVYNGANYYAKQSYDQQQQGIELLDDPYGGDGG